jgi:hypothetical protein
MSFAFPFLRLFGVRTVKLENNQTFQLINEKPDADPINIPLLDPGDVNELNENINMKFSKEEILKCIKKLKNKKKPVGNI